MNNWRQVLSWEEPSSLLGWLVQLQQKPNFETSEYKKFYTVVCYLNSNAIWGFAKDTAGEAIEEYNNLLYQPLQSYEFEDFNIHPLQQVV